MRSRLSKFLSGAAVFFLAAAVIHAIVLVVSQAARDYGWLGVVVVIIVGLGFIWLVPLLGWFFLPTGEMWILVITLAIAWFCYWASGKLRPLPRFCVGENTAGAAAVDAIEEILRR